MILRGHLNTYLHIMKETPLPYIYIYIYIVYAYLKGDLFTGYIYI